MDCGTQSLCHFQVNGHFQFNVPVVVNLCSTVSYVGFGVAVTGPATGFANVSAKITGDLANLIEPLPLLFSIHPVGFSLPLMGR